MGIHGGEGLTVNHKEVMQHVRKLRDRFVRGVMSSFSQWKDTHFIAKKAIFIDQNTLDLEGEKIQAEKIILATGSRPFIPEPWMPYEKYLIDTNAFFEMDDLPETLAVIGLGVIGIELGQALHRLGVKVTAISRRKVIGGLSDPEMVEYVSDKFSEEMDIDFTGVESLSENNGKLVVKTVDRTIEVDKALLAIGRKPNVEGIGLESIGIPMDENGFPKFDTHTMQIEGTSIFMPGDVNEERPLLHEAADDGAISGYNAVASEITPFTRRTFLGITFSDPNIAVVGKGHSQLLDEGINFKEGKVSFEGQGRSIVKLKEKGLLKIYGDTKTGAILGAEIFGPSGEHIAHLIAWAIQNELTAHKALSMPFYHPVIEEGLRTALRDLASKMEESQSPLELSICQDHPTHGH